MILKDNAPVHVRNPKKIKIKHGGVSEIETKEYNVVFKKSRLKDNFDTLTYGFDWSILFRVNIRFIYLFILVGKSAINRGAIAYFNLV